MVRQNEVPYAEKVRMYKDMMFTKYRNAAVLTNEKQIRITVSEAKMIFDFLNDYVEVLDGRTDEHI